MSRSTSLPASTSRSNCPRRSVVSAFLARIGEALGSTLDTKYALRRLADVIVPAIGDAFEVALLSQEGELERVVVVGPDDEWATHQLDASVPLLAWHPLAQGRP